jgi:exopolysaccharide production protein ExoZ
MNQSIQVARAIAVILVVAMHTMNLGAGGQSAAVVEQIAVWMRNIGHFGVDIFFVISGFIIAKLVANSAETKAAPINFAFRRIARIYPLFWLTLAAMMSVPAFPGAKNTIASLMERPLSLLLASPPLVHPVAWTLVYEMHFYLIAAACLLCGRRAPLALLVWCAIQVGIVFAADSGFIPQYLFFKPLSLEFCLGVALSFFAHKAPLPLPIVWGSLALGLATIAGFYFGGNSIAFDQVLRFFFWGLPAALIVWAAVSYELIRTKSHSALSAIGDASYALYMWHLPVLMISSWLVAVRGQSLGVFLIYIAISMIGLVVVSWLSFRYFETPINQFAKYGYRSKTPAMA